MSSGFKSANKQTEQLAEKNCTNQLLENLKK